MKYYHVKIWNYQMGYLWLVKITLVVAFGFLPQNFERWQGPMNCLFA